MPTYGANKKASYIVGLSLQVSLKTMPSWCFIVILEIDEMLRTADKDGNGAFSYDEFRLMIGATLSMNGLK